jgi:IS30 family transposase
LDSSLNCIFGERNFGENGMMKNTSRKGFRHLNQKDRDRMEALIDQDETQEEIAKILKVSQSSISREWKRRRKNGHYDADTAQHKAAVERGHSKYQGMKVEGNKPLKGYIIAGLMAKRSPDEIAGRMKRDKLPFYASKNAIYKWLYSIYGQRYCPLLCSKRYRKRKQKRKTKRVMIPNRIGISKRPRGATNKTRYGHFEADTARSPKYIPNNEGIAIAAERISKLLVGGKIPSSSPVEMTKAMKLMRKNVRMKSSTLDNGIENKHHEQWGLPTFFADAHSPWQKPIIENSIGLVRRWFFPKGTDWAQVTEAEFQNALLMLNSKYRKSLKYQNALEVARAHGIMKKMPKE